MENEVGEKFLPIGSVVMLKGGTKRVMITGYCAISDSNKNEVWDYSGCLYPEGVLSSNQTALFDHKQISKVFYIGLADEEQEKFVSTLKNFLDENQDKINEILKNNLNENKETTNE